MIIETILLLLSLAASGMAFYFMWRSATYADALKDAMQEMSSLKLRMNIFENDFSEKFDQFAKRLGSREKMRAKRDAEQPEDSNTPGVLVAI